MSEVEPFVVACNRRADMEGAPLQVTISDRKSYISTLHPNGAIKDGVPEQWLAAIKRRIGDVPMRFIAQDAAAAPALDALAGVGAMIAPGFAERPVVSEDGTRLADA